MTARTELKLLSATMHDVQDWMSDHLDDAVIHVSTAMEDRIAAMQVREPPPPGKRMPNLEDPR
jgi:hypothetical protein